MCREMAVLSLTLRTRWMSPGGAKPLTSPVRFGLLPTSIRAVPSSESVYRSSYSTPARTPKTHQVTWSWMRVCAPGCQTMATIENEPSGSTCRRWPAEEPRSSVPTAEHHGCRHGKGPRVAERISEREAEVLTALGARLSNAQIANRLHISVRTVESHVSSLLRKYGMADRWALAELARSGVREPGRIAGLPASGTTFVGRAAERAAVLAAVEEARLVTLLGPGGVGKTRLAAVVAGDAVALFPSGGAFVDLVPVRDGFVARAVATALGVTEGSHQPLAEAVAARLGTGRWLLVLDNCEHVIDEATAFAEQILAACPGARVLVTSRERLGLPGERSVPISPLPLAGDAERLFHDR